MLLSDRRIRIALGISALGPVPALQVGPPLPAFLSVLDGVRIALKDGGHALGAPVPGLGLPRKSGRCRSYAAIAAAACFSNCTGLRYPSDECRREGL